MFESGVSIHCREGDLSEAQEDYLKQVLLLGERCNGVVTTQALADRLAVRPASVTGMIRRLAEQDLVEHQPYHGVRLKAEGRRVALEQIRRHRLLETWLVRSLGFGWDEVHPEAERLEHVISKNFEKRIDALMGHPTHDPHGDPIPTEDLQWPADSARCPLVDLEPGTSRRVVQVMGQDRDTLALLARLGLVPGQVVSVQTVGAGGLTIVVDGDRFLLPRETASLVMVEDER